MTPKDLFTDASKYWYDEKLKYIFDLTIRESMNKFYTKHIGLPKHNNIYSIVVESSVTDSNDD